MLSFYDTLWELWFLVKATVPDCPPGLDLYNFPLPMASEKCPICLDNFVHYGEESKDELVQNRTLDFNDTLTLLCCHQFHFGCLRQWAESSTCPVCRLNIVPEATTKCEECGTRKKLWLCLICGHVGCSRFVNEHAREHFQATDHAYVLCLETRKVWDYISEDHITNRLIQDHLHQKILEVDGKPSGIERITDNDWRMNQKLLDKANEYKFLLVKQLKEQRELLLEELESRKNPLQGTKEVLASELREVESKLNKIQKNMPSGSPRVENPASDEKEIDSLERQNEKLKKFYHTLLRDKQGWYRELALIEKESKAAIDQNIESLDVEIANLQITLRDLEFNEKSRKKCSNEDMRGASVKRRKRKKKR